MALPLENSLDGTSGGAVTGFDNVVGTGITLDSGAAAHGATGMRIVTAATVAAAYGEWTTSLGSLSTGQTLNVRWYYKSPSNPTSSVRMLNILNGSTALVTINHASGSGDVAVQASGVTQTPQTGTALTVGIYYRIEAALTGIGGGATAGGYTVTVYVGDTATVLGSAITGSGKNFGTLAPNTLRSGVTTANASVSSTYDIDDVGVSATAMPGIPGSGPPGPLLIASVPARMTRRTA